MNAMNNPLSGPLIDSDMMVRVMRDMVGDEDAFNSPIDRNLIDLFLLMEQAKNVLILQYAEQAKMRHNLQKGKR